MAGTTKDSINWRSVLVGGLIASAVGLVGFALLQNQRGEMGAVLFLLLPLIAGFAPGLIVSGSRETALSIVLTFIVCTLVLLVANFEGWVCILMSAPLIFAGLIAGAMIGRLARQLVDKLRLPRAASFMMLPILILFLSGANSVERASYDFTRVETVTSTVTLDASPQQIWDAIKRVDRIDLPRPFLLRIGLPVPVSCDLEAERVGAERTCHFDSGYIKERITEWQPPASMKMDVVDSKVPGRDWLNFREASYQLEERNGGTLLIRKTTIVSHLLPAWYWRPLERIGVETEHNYLLEYLRKATAPTTARTN